MCNLFVPTTPQFLEKTFSDFTLLDHDKTVNYETKKHHFSFLYSVYFQVFHQVRKV